MQASMNILSLSTLSMRCILPPLHQCRPPILPTTPPYQQMRWTSPARRGLSMRVEMTRTKRGEGPITLLYWRLIEISTNSQFRGCPRQCILVSSQMITREMRFWRFCVVPVVFFFTARNLLEHIQMGCCSECWVTLFWQYFTVYHYFPCAISRAVIICTVAWMSRLPLFSFVDFFSRMIRLMGLVNQACKRPLRTKVSSKRKKPKFKDLLFVPKPESQRYPAAHAHQPSPFSS